MTDRTKRIAIVGAGLIIIMALLIGFLPSIPPRFFKSENFRGVRLVRDAEESGLYFDRSRWVPERVLPYRDVFIEYPQLAAAYLGWPRLFTQDPVTYEQILFAVNGVLYAALFTITWRILILLKYSRRRLLLFLLPAMLYFSFNRFDILPALLVQLSVFALLSKRIKWTIGLLVIAGFVKWYAWLLLPLYWYWLRRTISTKDLQRRFMPGLFLATTIITLSFLLVGGKTLDPYRFHIQGRSFGQDTIFRSLIGSHLESGFAALLLALQAAVPIAGIFFGQWLSRRHCSLTSLIRLSLISLLAFMLFAKFYSPQWIIWVIPLFCLLPLRRTDYSLLIGLDLISFIQFPVLFDMFSAASEEYFIIVLVRTLLTIWLLIRLIGDEKRVYSRANSVGEAIEAR